MKRPNSRKYTREIRREEAEKRQEVRDNRTSRQQLDALDHRLGVDIGAIKERTRLLLDIAGMPQKKRKK
jgi:hypothetical protein